MGCHHQQRFIYDNDGNRLAQYTLNAPVHDERKRFSYDALNRTVGLRDRFHDTGGSGECAHYDPDGQLARTCDDAAEWLTFDGANVAGTLGTRWVFVSGPGVDDPLVGLWRDPTGGSTLTSEFYWITDGAGRQFAAGTPEGAMLEGPYLDNGGKFAGGAGNASSFGASRFEADKAPGFSYFRNRVYDQATGRWTQEDPIGLAGGLNLYQFNGNNPVSYSDPFGLAPCPPDCGAEDAADLGAGFVPGVSTLHDAATLVTGKNLITGEQVGAGGRTIALVGLVTPASGGQVRGLIAGAKHLLSEGLQRVTGGLSDRALQRTYTGAIGQINRHKEILQNASPEQVNSIMKDIRKHENRLQAAVEEMERRGMSSP